MLASSFSQSTKQLLKHTKLEVNRCPLLKIVKALFSFIFAPLALVVRRGRIVARSCKIKIFKFILKWNPEDKMPFLFECGGKKNKQMGLH